MSVFVRCKSAACYDEGKRCAETLFFDYHRQHNLDIPLPQDDPKQRQPDITLAKSRLNWEPKAHYKRVLSKPSSILKHFWAFDGII